MGFLKNLWNDTKKYTGIDAIEKAFNDVTGKSNSTSAPAVISPYDQAYAKVSSDANQKIAQQLRSQGVRGFQQGIQATKLLKEYMETTEAKQKVTAVQAQIQSGVNVNSASVGNILAEGGKGILGGLLEGIKNGVITGAQQAVQVGTDKLLNGKTGKSLQNTVGDFLGGIADKATAGWFKRNWYYILIPFTLIGFIFFRNRSKKTTSRVRRKR